MPPPKLVPFSKLTVNMDRIITNIAITHNIFVMLYIIKLNWKSKELVANNPSQSKKLFIVTIINMIITIISVIDVWMLSDDTMGISCHSLMINRAFAYILLRFGYWYYNLFRLEIIFHDTLIAYSSKFIKICLYLLISIALFLTIFLFWGIQFGNEYIIMLSPYNSCVASMKPIIAITLALVEATTNVVLFWLFYRK